MNPFKTTTRATDPKATTRAADPLVQLFAQIDHRDMLRAELALLRLKIRMHARKVV